MAGSGDSHALGMTNSQPEKKSNYIPLVPPLPNIENEAKEQSSSSLIGSGSLIATPQMANPLANHQLLHSLLPSPGLSKGSIGSATVP